MQLESQQDLEKLQAATTDLRSCIKSIEWDLQDLDETISKEGWWIQDYYITVVLLIDIAESNPSKFRLSVGEIESRKNFIRETRQIVNVST